MSSRRKRVFLGTVEIAGFYTKLASALRASGVDCAFVELLPHPFNYGFPDVETPRIVQWVQMIARLHQALPHKTLFDRFRRFALHILNLALRIALVLPWAAHRFDVFCFGFATNIVGTGWGYWDIALLRFLGKRIIFMFHGADSRPPYLTGPYVRRARSGSLDWSKALYELTCQRRREIDAINRNADVIIDASVHGHFHTRRLVDYAWIGFPCPVETGASDSSRRLDDALTRSTVRILHAPSDRDAKGSDLIAACIDRLKNEGHDIEYYELHGLPNATVVRELGHCDFVIDQLYSDFPLAGFAAEAASQGKPAVVCGYVQDRNLIDRFPTHYCHPDELESAVRRLLLEPEYRKRLGHQAKQFVEESWAPLAVARKWQRIIDGTIPHEWWFDPNATTYVHGGGMSEELLRETVRELVRRYGLSALELDDKPTLRDRLLKLSLSVDSRVAPGAVAIPHISGR